MAAELCALTLAEGIETERQEDFCLKADVALDQGYLFGKPE